MAKVKLSKNNGKQVLSITWPDKLRSRIRVYSDADAEEKCLAVKLSFLNGTWSDLRARMISGEVKPDIKTASFVSMAEDYYENWVKQRNKSWKTKRTQIDRFKSRFRAIPPRAFREVHVQKYISWRLSAGVKNSTINREMTCLKHMFSWAVKMGYVEKSPISLVEKLYEPDWDGPKPTSDAVEGVISKLPPAQQAVFIVIRETGARRGEVFALKHWQVDRESRTILLRQTKTGKSTIAPLTKRAMEAIDSIPVLQGCDYVFYNPDTGTRWIDLKRSWNKARKEAGYPWLRIRDLRPAFAINAAELGAPMHFIQSALGHTSVQMTERYYAKFDKHSAARALLDIVELGTSTGTNGK